MIVSIIVAVAENGVIGKNNRLLWRLRDDMKNFKRLTTGHYILMGRKTFESIGKPLKDRTNIVITRNAAFSFPGVVTAGSADHALQYAADHGQHEVFVIGGAEIYRELLPVTGKIYFTRVKAVPDGDVYFPELDWNEWNIVRKEMFLKSDQNDHDFDILELERANFDRSSKP